MKTRPDTSPLDTSPAVHQAERLGLIDVVAGVSGSLWGAVVLAAAAGFGAMLLPPVMSEVDWSGAKGDE